jgi:hypothetical protein
MIVEADGIVEVGEDLKNQKSNLLDFWVKLLLSEMSWRHLPGNKSTLLRSWETSFDIPHCTGQGMPAGKLKKNLSH